MFHEGLKSTIKLEQAEVEFEALQALMDRPMVVKARNLAWREKGGGQWRRRCEAGSKSNEGFNRGTNWARPNNFNSYS